MRNSSAAAALVLCLPLLAAAQSAPSRSGVHSFYSDDLSGHSFALVRGQDVMLNGSWRGGSELDTYAHAHPGHYLLFLDGSTLHRTDAPGTLEAAERAYAPMLPLNARQAELSGEMKPLSAQQHALGEQQHAASGHPDEQMRIGREQARVGEQQGEIGRKQGEVGRQQGEAGRAFYNRVQQLITECLGKNTCPAVQGG